MIVRYPSQTTGPAAPALPPGDDHTDPPMEKFVIQGATPLSGEIVAAGNKNAALPILAACLLTDEEIVLTNVPRIRDTESQVALLEGLGVKVAWSGQNELRLQADTVSDTSLDEELAARIRASFL